MDSEERLAILENQLKEQREEIESLKTIVNNLVERLERIEPAKVLAKPKLNRSLVKLNNLDKKEPPTPPLVKKPFQLIRSSLSFEMSNKKTSSPLTKGTSKLQSNSEYSYNQENGMIKFFIRGRPITFYLPSSNDSYSFYIEATLKAPKSKLKLEWAHGYRGKDCRSNLYTLESGELIYFIAGIVVLYDVEASSQRFYLGHTDDVKSIAIHPNKIIVASGQTAGHDKLEGKPHVRVWNSNDLTTLKIIGLKSSDFQTSICCLSFSKVDSGQRLAVVDDGNEKWLSIWDWENEKKIGNAKCHNDLVFGAEFSSYEKNLIITIGKQHFAFWNYDEPHLSKKMGVFESSTKAKSSYKFDKPKYVTCLLFSSNKDIISGDSEGNILIWNAKESKIDKIIKQAHDGTIFSILSTDEGFITGGGKVGVLIEWSKDFQKTGRTLKIPESNGNCRIISSIKNKTSFLIGTTKNLIFEANFDEEPLKRIVSGHDGELWGLAANSRQAKFLTCGYDKNMSYWDLHTHELIFTSQFEETLQCVNIHPRLDLAAVGFSSKPKLVIFDLNERKEIFSQLIGSEQIECLSFSPNGSYLALGSRDNFIYMYSVSEDGLTYLKIGKCSGHSSFITHLDWCINSEYIMSNSGDYECLIWDAKTCKQITHTELIRDLVFATNTCVFSLNNLGIWNSGTQNSSITSYDGTDINMFACSESKKLGCFVDDLGKVNLIDYPCYLTKTEKHVYQAHSSHVTNVVFINNDTHILTLGGNDMSILQWLVIND